MSGLVRSQASRDGAWQRLQLNAPPGNLLSLDLVRALGKALHDLQSTPGIKWLTIEGAGDEFSFGAKIQEHEPGLMATVLPETHRVIRQVLEFPAPTAALVNGRCLGGGFELALACDDILATDSAALLPLRVGASRATRAIVTGQLQAAGYWHEAGLLSMVAPTTSLIEAAGTWFDTHLSPHSSVAQSHADAASRLTLRAQAEPALEKAERDYLSGLLKTRDAAEGVQAWIDKRAPNWKNS